MIFKEVMLSPEETQIFEQFRRDIRRIDCESLSCLECPLNITGQNNGCLVGVITKILDKYGYKEENKTVDN